MQSAETLKVPPMQTFYMFYMFLLQETDALVTHTSRQKVPPMNKCVYVLYVFIAKDRRVRDAHKSTESSADADILYVLYAFIARDGRVRDAHKSTESSADDQMCVCLTRFYCKRPTRS